MRFPDADEMRMVRVVREWDDETLIRNLRDPRRATIDRLDAYMVIFAESLARLLENKQARKGKGK